MVVKLFFFVVVVVTLAVVVLSGGTVVDIIIDMVELVVDVMELVELIELVDVFKLVDELVVKVVVGGWDESGFSTHCPDLYVVLYKVKNRCLARYSPRAKTTNQPTNRAPNEPAKTGPK